MGTMVASLAVCVSALSINPSEMTMVDEVDLIEINHFFDERGRLVFDQIIFYDWSDEHARFQVRDWRLLKEPSQVPLKNWRDRDYVAVWHDFKSRDVLRKVRAKGLQETWTQYDPELVERNFLPAKQRRKLCRVPAPLAPVPTAEVARRQVREEVQRTAATHSIVR